jgi:hypothetical protein
MISSPQWLYRSRFWATLCLRQSDSQIRPSLLAVNQVTTWRVASERTSQEEPDLVMVTADHTLTGWSGIWSKTQHQVRTSQWPSMTRRKDEHLALATNTMRRWWFPKKRSVVDQVFIILYRTFTPQKQDALTLILSQFHFSVLQCWFVRCLCHIMIVD